MGTFDPPTEFGARVGRTGLILLFAIFLDVQADEPDLKPLDPVAEAGARECPRSTEAWRKFNLRLIKSIASRMEDASIDDGYSFDEKVDFLIATRCFKEEEKVWGDSMSPYLKGCVQPVISLIKLLEAEGVLGPREGGYAYELPVSDSEYLKSIDVETQIPPELSSREFLLILNQRTVNSLTEYLVGLDVERKHRQGKEPLFASTVAQRVLNKMKLQAVYAYLDDLNSSRTKSGKSPLLFSIYEVLAPPSRVREIRLTIMVPGDSSNGGVDRWFAMNPFREDSVLFSVLSVTPGNPPTVAWRDHKRTGDAVSSPHAAVFKDVSCKKCHQSGLIVPHRSDRPQSGKDYQRFEQLVEKASSYSPQMRARLPNPQLPFPALGEDLSNVEECLNHYKSWVSPERVQAVKNSMNCIDCHNGKNRQRLMPPFGKSIQEFINKGIMPLGNELNENERLALSTCLIKSYFRYPKDDEVKIGDYFPQKSGPLWNTLSKMACVDSTNNPSDQRQPKKTGDVPGHVESKTIQR